MAAKGRLGTGQDPLVDPVRSLHRERVMDVLWPDLDPVDAAPRLHKAAHFARQATGERDAVVLRGETVALFPGARVVVDIEQLEEAFAAAGGGTAEDAAAVLDAFPGEVPAGGRSAMPVLPCWAGPAGCAGCVPGWMVGSRSGRCPVLVSCVATVVSLVLWCSDSGGGPRTPLSWPPARTDLSRVTPGVVEWSTSRGHRNREMGLPPSGTRIATPMELSVALGSVRPTSVGAGLCSATTGGWPTFIWVALDCPEGDRAGG